jgi:uncharacterized protein YccT (UPF0319 family)
MDGDYANVTNFSPNLVGIQNDGSSNCSYILVSPAPFPVLVAHGINGCFVNNHLSISSWPSWMSPYIKASDNTTVMAVAGIYPSGGHGRLIVQGPDQDYHAVRNGADPGGNQYKIMLNQIDFLSGNQGNFTWSGPNGYTATGGNPVIDGATATNAGVYTVTLTNTTGGGCSASATTTVTVNIPSAINGNTGSICGGGTLALSGSTGGGTWSSNNTAVASVDASGIVTGVSGGTAAVTYTMAGGCPSFTIVTVNPPVAITGASSVVKTNTTILSDASAGGIWSSGNTAFATVNASGVITGVTYGSATISYTIGSCYVTKDIFVTPAPYCTPAYTNAALACSTYSMYIINFSSNGANGSALSDNASGCTGTGYQDRRLAIAPVTFKASNAYTASITVGPTYQQYVQAWIDFNDNSVFEASETVGGINNLLNTGSFAITIPSGATLGTHTMRVRCGYTGTTTAYPNMDACANYSYGEAQDYFVNVVPNCVAPAITACPASLSQSSAAGLCGANVDFGAATVSGTTPTVTYSAASGSLFALGTTSVNVTATNSCGTATCSFNVTVTDDENPTITAPADVTAYTSSGCSATDVALGSPATGDNCSVASVTNDHSETTYGLGTTMVTWTVTDGSGHTATAMQNVTVTDNVNPTITAPADVTVYTNAGCPATDVALGTPATDDNCSVASVTNDHSASTYGLGTTNVLWTVTDGSGNAATATQHVTVIDNVNPTITAPADVTVYTNAGCTATYVTLGTPATDDNCSVASVTNDHSATTYGLGTTNVLWTVTDGSGNTATATQHVTVIDNVNPTITAPADVTAYSNAGCTATGVVLGTPATGDNCSVASVTNDQNSDTYPVGTTMVTWTITDGSGNTTSAMQTVTVIDNINPTITAPATVTRNGYCVPVTADLGIPSTGDNCGVASVINNAPSLFPVGTTTVTWTVTDIHANTATAIQLVVVTPATVTLGGTVSNVSCNGGSNGGITTSVGGGTSPYSYAWTTGATSANITGKTSGGYTVTATDAHGCVASHAFTITQPAVLTGTFAMDAIRKTASCPNGLILYGYDANINASATGGTTPYAYTWGTATSGCTSCATASLTAPSGTYSVTITDAHGCTTIVSTSCGRDVRCTAGNSGNHKITVCHNGHDICIDSSALATHLGLGDAIGSCSLAKGAGVDGSEGQFAIKAFPNPYSEEINIQVESDNLKDKADIIVYDLTGRIVDSRVQQVIGQTVTLGKNLIPGVYIAEVRLGSASEKVKIVKY